MPSHPAHLYVLRRLIVQSEELHADFVWTLETPWFIQLYPVPIVGADTVTSREWEPTYVRGQQLLGATSLIVCREGSRE